MFKNLSPEVFGISGRDSEIIELTLSHGFKGFDVNLQEFAEQVKTHGFAKAARLITSARLKMGSFVLPIRWQEDAATYKAELEKLAALADIAQQLGCTRAVTMIEAGSDLRPYHENFAVHCQRLTEIAEVLGRHQIRLGLDFLAPLVCRAEHNFQFMQRVDEVLLLFRSINAPNIGLALDAWHWHLGGGTLEQIRALGVDKLVTVSLADIDPALTSADAKLTDRKLPSEEGAIDSPGLLTVLAEMGYTGPVTPTADASQFPGQSREKIVKAASAAFDQVWKAAGLSPTGKLATVRG